MGYIKAVEADILVLPSDPQYVVRMKKWASYGDVEGARAAMLKLAAGQDPASAELKWQAYIQTLVVSLIVDWNLTDEAEHPLPVTVETLALLDPIDGDLLAKEAQRRTGVRSQTEEIPFAKPSGNS